MKINVWYMITYFGIWTWLIAVVSCIEPNKDLARGLGDDYKWYTLEDGIQHGLATQKPLMIIIHKSWCGACKALKPKFSASKEALTLSNNFVMINLLDDEEPTDKKYTPDGGYIPRILFLDYKGTFHPELYNSGGNENYKYFYHDDKSVISTMKQAIEVFGSPQNVEL